MRFTAKDAADLADELAELKLPRSYMASLVGVNVAYVTQYFSGVRTPTDDVLRKMRAVCVIIRSEHLRSGGFALNKENMDKIRKRLAAMEKSIIRRGQPADDDADADEEKKCRTTVN